MQFDQTLSVFVPSFRNASRSGNRAETGRRAYGRNGLHKLREEGSARPGVQLYSSMRGGGQRVTGLYALTGSEKGLNWEAGVESVAYSIYHRMW